ncbi:hypothetical protein Asp14428_02050 [Actinoplanes sp. NBRC 14428]|nr:hypothetical protein Asp14428_02050 [Actinoplanes sp. NBRC 14428]
MSVLASRTSDAAVRPRVLNVAGYLLLVQAVLMLVALGTSLYYGDLLSREGASAGAAAGHLAGRSAEPTAFGIACLVTATAVLAALAVLVLRANAGARIAALVLSVAGTAAGLRLLYSAPAPADEGPRWYEANSVVGATQLAVLLTYLGIAACLAVHHRAGVRR